MFGSLASAWNEGTVPQGQPQEKSDRGSLTNKCEAERRIGAVQGHPYTPHPMHECQKKGVVRRAICKCMKRNNEDGSSGRMAWDSRMGIVGTHPAVFVRVANKGVAGYGTWKSV